MDLKELLGEELYRQVMDKAGDNKLAVVSDGNWFPKDKFDGKNQEVKDLQEQLKDRDKQLKDLGDKAKGNDDLTAEIDQLKEANKTTKEEYEAKLQQQAFDHTLENSLNGAKVKNTKAVKALLDMETIKLDGDTLKGLDDQLKGLQESDPYLFEQEQQGTPPPTIVNPGNPNGGSNEPTDPFAAKLAKYN
ncbi:phage scaffolding protein [Oceanobacillus sojae]|uniref:Scaffold protein n=1 Tax=Oceanobacillus sojae TaxID=582851 RepID=A0A511ZIJ1_9BACI|nr:phage scaffolding protein [Oceanobacillus sojae]GEN87245.1 scaffold protein [Oceanobacillus sojae]